MFCVLPGKTPVELAPKNLLYLLTDGKEGALPDPESKSTHLREEDIFYYWDTLLSGKREHRIPEEYLEGGNKIGEGNFGNVYATKYIGPQPEGKEEEEGEKKRRSIPTDLAAKFLRGNLNGQRRYRELLRLEILTMIDLNHPNIIHFVGLYLFLVLD